jgi:hypothetical protein
MIEWSRGGVRRYVTKSTICTGIIAALASLVTALVLRSIPFKRSVSIRRKEKEPCKVRTGNPEHGYLTG